MVYFRLIYLAKFSFALLADLGWKIKEIIRDYKNLVFKNQLGQNLPVRPPLYKNPFSLKFETGVNLIKLLQV